MPGQARNLLLEGYVEKYRITLATKCFKKYRIGALLTLLALLTKDSGYQLQGGSELNSIATKHLSFSLKEQ